MSTAEDPLRFPPLCDAAVLAVSDWLEPFLIDFQNHYFAQLRGSDVPSTRRDSSLWRPRNLGTSRRYMDGLGPRVAAPATST
jgi:hypothetical protein